MGQLVNLSAELIVTLSALILLLVGAFAKSHGTNVVRYGAIAAMLAFAFIGLVFNGNGSSFDGAFISDGFSRYLKLLIGLSAAAALAASIPYLKLKKIDYFEYSILMLFAVLGMGVMVSAGNLLTLYVGIELQSLALYVLAAFNKDSLRSTEAGLKYFVLGSLSSGIMLYGISMIYGFGGSISYEGIAQYLANTETVSSGLITGLVFLLAGLAFKISAAPFHMWTPDVYEGAPTPVTGFFAAAPKLAAIALITRLVVDPFAALEFEWKQIIVILSLLSLIVGTFGALTQRNIKRLMGYSSIANMGYALVALAAGGAAGVSGLLIFMSIYVITVIGIFACILQMQTREGMVENIDDLGGLSSDNMPLALSFTGLMFSVAGMPFFLGFIGKWFAFAPAVNNGLTWLVVIALLTSVIAAFYYLRIIKVIWFDEKAAEFVEPSRFLITLSLVTSGFLAVALLLPWVLAPARQIIEAATQSLF